MHWIKEVEMVDSADDLKTSQSFRGHRFQNFEMLDAKIVSTVRQIHHKFELQEKSQSISPGASVLGRLACF